MFGGASARGLFSSSFLVPVSARCIRFLGGGGGGLGGSAHQPPGSVGTPTYIPQNDPHDALIILNIHKWCKNCFRKNLPISSGSHQPRSDPEVRPGVKKFSVFFKIFLESPQNSLTAGAFPRPSERALGTFSIWLLLCRPARGGYFTCFHGSIARTCSFIGLLDKRLQLVWR